MIGNEIRKFMFAVVMSFGPILILSILFDNPLWFDIIICVSIIFPIYHKTANRLDVEVM